MCMMSPHEYKEAAAFLSAANNKENGLAERLDAAIDLLGVLLNKVEVNWNDPEYLAEMNFDCEEG